MLELHYSKWYSREFIQWEMAFSRIIEEGDCSLDKDSRVMNNEIPHRTDIFEAQRKRESIQAIYNN